MLPVAETSLARSYQGVARSQEAIVTRLCWALPVATLKRGWTTCYNFYFVYSLSTGQRKPRQLKLRASQDNTFPQPVLWREGQAILGQWRTWSVSTCTCLADYDDTGNLREEQVEQYRQNT